METLKSLDEIEYDVQPTWPLEDLSASKSPTASQHTRDSTHASELDLNSVHPRIQEIHTSQRAQTEKV